MHYLVMCNDHKNVLFHMRRYEKEQPGAHIDYPRKSVFLGNDIYHFFAKTEDPNSLLSMVFDGMIIPPDYRWYDNVEVVAMSRVRFNHVTTDSRASGKNS